MTWVQLLRSQYIEKAGVSRQYYPGDWVEVGKQTAQRWVIDKAARFAKPQVLVSLDGCGVLSVAGKAGLEHGVPTVVKDAPSLPYARTLIAGMQVRPELVPVGFGLLETWEVAAPLWSYEQLAIHIGTKAAQERTQALIGDLRVPVYESRMVWVKRCRAGESLIEAWNEERETGDDERLCFLRALWRVKPLICPLPCTWHA